MLSKSTDSFPVYRIVIQSLYAPLYPAYTIKICAKNGLVARYPRIFGQANCACAIGMPGISSTEFYTSHANYGMDLFIAG